MKGWVYKLYCKDLAIKEIYVGSSMNINQRMDFHKSSCKYPNSKGYNYKVYRFIRSNGGYDAWTYEILEECDVKDKEDLVLNYERKYQLELDPQLNVRIDGRTKRQWKIDNKEILKIKAKEYREENKEKMSIRDKEYRERNKEQINQKFNCECGGKYTRQHIKRHERTKIHQAFLNL